MKKRRIRHLSIASAAALCAALLSGAASADVPGTVTHQGRLYDATNKPVSGAIEVVLTLYDGEDPASSNALWKEAHIIDFDDGYFSVALGGVTPLGDALDGSVRYLGIQVGKDPEMAPRAAIRSVPYALLAGNVTGHITPQSISIPDVGMIIDENGQWVGDTAGIEGPAGPAGPQGQTGAQGPEGPQGAPGAQGPAGAPGAVGPTGSEGPQGAAGPQGLAGPAGPAGPAGAIGPQGAAGPQGLAGAIGPQGPTGAAGPQGPAGAAGPQGPAGETGPAGPAGPEGLTGALGPQGPAGATGPQGPVGSVGPQGPQGTTGPTGPAGAQGPTGLTGAMGAQGPAGPQGPAGGSMDLLFTRTPIFPASSDAMKDAQCVAELGVEYRAASQLDVQALYRSTLTSGPYFVMAGTSQSAIVSINGEFLYLTVGAASNQQVACARLSASLLFTRAQISSASSEAMKDAQCIAELGAGYRAASQLDVQALYRSTLAYGPYFVMARTSQTGYVDTTGPFLYIAVGAASNQQLACARF